MTGDGRMAGEKDSRQSGVRAVSVRLILSEAAGGVAGGGAGEGAWSSSCVCS